MKKSAIEIIMESVFANMYFEENTPYANALSKLCDCDDFMREQLKDKNELIEAYKNVTDSMNKMCMEESDAYFKEGFLFGVTLGLEIAKYGE